MFIRIPLVALTLGSLWQAAEVDAVIDNHPGRLVDRVFAHQFALTSERKSLGPLTYQNREAYWVALAKRNAEDRAWALANVVPVVEGPWGSIASKKVYYFGIDVTGERVRLPKVSNLWRWSPIDVQIPHSGRAPTPIMLYLPARKLSFQSKRSVGSSRDNPSQRYRSKVIQ